MCYIKELCVKLVTYQKSYHLPAPTVLKSGGPNFLEPSGPVQTCLGITLHFTDELKKVSLFLLLSSNSELENELTEIAINKCGR